MTKELLVSTLHEIVEKTHSDRAYVPGAELISGDALAFVADFISNNLEEIKHGQWIEQKSMMYCSECSCGFDIIMRHDFCYCPNCGTVMDESDDAELVTENEEVNE